MLQVQLSLGAAATLCGALITIALLCLLLSTRQSALAHRLSCLASGAVAVIGAWWAAGHMTGLNLVSVLHELFAHWRRPQDSVLLETLALNAAGSLEHVPALLNATTALVTLLFFVSVLALTPGEAAERFVRFGAAGLAGAIFGAAFALALVAIGFGDVVRPRAYLAEVTSEDVLDGDTIRIGEISVRLNGIDAPEKTQDCPGLIGRDVRCGETAKEELASLVEGADWVKCESSSGSKVHYNFGRPIMKCEIIRENKPTDLGVAMLESGYATVFSGRMAEPAPDAYASAAEKALESRAGLMSGCWTDPRRWRKDKKSLPSIGTCS